MWFIFAVICLLGWGFADLFYKKSSDSNDRHSHLKIAVWVGIVMGLAAVAILIFVPGTTFSFSNLLIYSPASAMYILSMIIGYAGMRYLEISIVSPVQNASGAVSAVMMVIYFIAIGKISDIGEELDWLSIAGTVAICIGMVLLAVTERKVALSENPTAPKKFKTGAAALIFPILYCVFDALGTFADGVILEGNSYFGIETVSHEMSEWDVLVAYGITFFLVAVVCWIIMAVKGEVYNPIKDKDKAIAACFEEFGQIFYVFALADKPYYTAPIVASYCIVSVILSRIFLKEKLTKKQYVCIFIIIAGIVAMGIAEGLAELGGE